VEEIQAQGGKPRAVRIVVVLALVAFLATCAVIAAGRFLRGYSLRDALSPDVPVLELHVAFVDTFAKGKPADAAAGKELQNGAEASPEATSSSSLAPTPAAVCPVVVGGDLGATPPKRRRYGWEPTPVPCPLEATWRVYRNPVAVSVFLVRGSDALAWYDSNPKVAALRDSALWKGMVRQLADVAKVRAEELELADWKGEFIQPLVRDALAANASFHHDLIHGVGGIVFAFDRTKAHLVDKALPILIRGLATNAYEVKGYEQPLVELRFHGRTFFVTQVGDLVVLGSSLEGLINVLEQRPFAVPRDGGSVLAVVRPESFVDRLLIASVGAPQWPLSVTFELSATRSEISGATVPRARIFQSFAPNTASGVLAALPHDVMSTVVLSSHVPLEKPVSDWSMATGATVGASGLGLVWDVSGKERRVDVGIATLAPAGKEVSVRPTDFVSSRGVATTCAGGAVWIAASSDALLGRMRDSCEKQSLSIRDLKGLKEGALEVQQVSLLFNTGVWLHEMFELGGGGVDDAAGDSSGGGSSEDGQDGEREARARIEEMIAEVVPSLPVIGLMGRVDGQDSDLRLQGFMSTGSGA
jgi:hypothetical protein